MPPKTVFTKEQIIETAFEIFREEGIENLSVRKLAARMNSSTAPIYTSFENVDQIKEQLLEHALDILTEYTEKEYTGDAFLNIGLGLLEFARDYRTIYRKLFMEDNRYQYILKKFNERNLVQMKKSDHLKCFDDADLASMLEKMSVYTQGLAAMLCAGMLEDECHEYFLKELGEMGFCVISAYAFKRGHTEEGEFLKMKGCGS
jgi:AcrR family transcriptional regulator